MAAPHRYDSACVLRDYLAHVPLAEIERRYGISKKTIYNVYRRSLESEPQRFPHQCTLCPKRFSADRSLKIHRAKFHNQTVPKCSICDVDLSDENWTPAYRRRKQRMCLKCASADSTARNARERAALIAAYDGKCACCGETTPEFLTVDHINNDGAQHRRALQQNGGGGGGMTIYRWLRKRGYPKDAFQLLCANCNTAKGYYGYCPHQRQHIIPPKTPKTGIK